MLVKLKKRRGEYPTGAVVDMPADEAESLVAFGLAEAVGDIDAEAPTRLVERAEVKKNIKTATLPTEAASVAEIVEDEG